MRMRIRTGSNIYVALPDEAMRVYSPRRGASFWLGVVLGLGFMLAALGWWLLAPPAAPPEPATPPAAARNEPAVVAPVSGEVSPDAPAAADATAALFQVDVAPGQAGSSATTPAPLAIAPERAEPATPPAPAVAEPAAAAQAAVAPPVAPNLKPPPPPAAVAPRERPATQVTVAPSQPPRSQAAPRELAKPPAAEPSPPRAAAPPKAPASPATGMGADEEALRRQLKIKDYLRQADRLYQAGAFADAVTVLDKIVTYYPDSEEAAEVRGLIREIKRNAGELAQ